MRVIAGQFRGAVLACPEGRTTRPITDQVKETLFNILGSRFGLPGNLPEVEVLDLFAGSGALGIEALSRGAARALFVERDRTALRTLRANIAKLRLEERAAVSTENTWTMRVPRPLAEDGAYGLIFCDPPYRDAEQPQRVLDLLERLASSLSGDGALVLRHGSRNAYGGMPLRLLRCFDERRYGDMRVLLFERTRADAQDPPAA